MEPLTQAELQDALGFPLPVEFVEGTLGVRRALGDAWRRDQYGLIMGRLFNHLNGRPRLPEKTFDVDGFFN